METELISPDFHPGGFTDGVKFIESEPAYIYKISCKDTGKSMILEISPSFFGISFKAGTVVFGSPALKAMDAQGKMLKFYTETTKRIIAWKLTDKVEMGRDSNWRVVSVNLQNNNALFSVKPLLAEFRTVLPNPPDSLKAEIECYESQDIMDRGQKYYFVKLDNEVE